MWSEEMDKNIRAAAEKNVHQFEEKHWEDMKALLDTHLPEKKRRRRFIIFFLSSLVGLGLSGYLIVTQLLPGRNPVVKQNPSSPAQPTIAEKTNTVSIPAITSGEGEEKNKITDITQPENRARAGQVPEIFENNSRNNVRVNLSPERTNKDYREMVSIPQIGTPDHTPGQAKQTGIDPVNRDGAENRVVKIQDSAILNSVTANNDQQHLAPSMPTDSLSMTKSIPPVNNNTEPADSSSIALEEAGKKQSALKKRISKFSLNLSTGPDFSSAGMSTPGRIAIQYGVGIGYNISEKWTIRSGIYAGQKIYSADSTSYHMASNSGPYNFKLSNVDANCFVYEIPVSVVYNFATSKKHNWFVSAGLSSYLMKKETYAYTYKNPTGQTRTYLYTYRNKNTHLFSVLSLSGGYRYHFNNRFSLLAEPYFKSPVKGVGQGKVNLNSAGVLFTVSFNPFQK